MILTSRVEGPNKKRRLALSTSKTILNEFELPLVSSSYTPLGNFHVESNIQLGSLVAVLHETNEPQKSARDAELNQSAYFA